MEYLMYQDLDAKRPIPQKIADACARYEARFGVAPNVALVHPTEMTEAGIQVQARITVRPGTYWIGMTTEGEHDHAELENRMDRSHV